MMGGFFEPIRTARPPVVTSVVVVVAAGDEDHSGCRVLTEDGIGQVRDAVVPAGGEVPVKYYLKNGPRVSEDPNATTCSLERGQKMDVPVKVDSKGSTLCWKFQTSPGHDVGFGVLHIAGEHVKPKEILEVGKVKCDQVAETGRLSAEPGTYIFRFDNSNSWFTKKELSYVLQVKSSEEVLP
ncbi:SEC14-like protein 2 [Ixodes scapularis]